MTNKLNKILKEKNMTAYALSKIAGVTPSAVYKYIKEGSVPALDVAMKIANALTTDITQIWKL